MAYQKNAGSSIGSLLRFIQEQKSQSPIVPQGSEVGSPIRGATQEPLKGAESIGTSRQVSIKPESVLEGGRPVSAVEPQAAPQPLADAGVAVPKIVEGPMRMKVTGERAPSTRAPVEQANRVFSRTGTDVTPGPITQPNIGTSIGTRSGTRSFGGTAYGPDSDPSKFAPYGTYGPGEEERKTTPTRSNVGGVILDPGGKPKPTQTPSPEQTASWDQPSTQAPEPPAPFWQPPVNTIAPAIKKAAQRIAPMITQSPSPWSWLGKKTGWW